MPAIFAPVAVSVLAGVSTEANVERALLDGVGKLYAVLSRRHELIIRNLLAHHTEGALAHVVAEAPGKSAEPAALARTPEAVVEVAQRQVRNLAPELLRRRWELATARHETQHRDDAERTEARHVATFHSQRECNDERYSHTASMPRSAQADGSPPT